MCTWTGRIPAIAAPIATPVIASSDNGVVKTRSAPKRSTNPRVDLDPLMVVDVEAKQHDPRAHHLLLEGLAEASTW